MLGAEPLSVVSRETVVPELVLLVGANVRMTRREGDDDSNPDDEKRCNSSS